MLRLRQREAEVVMGLRQVRIRHYRLAKLFERAGAIVLVPVEQPEARMSLGIVRFQFERFLKGRQGASSVALPFPNDAQIVMARRQFGALLNGLLKQRL